MKLDTAAMPPTPERHKFNNPASENSDLYPLVSKLLTMIWAGFKKI